MKLFLKKKTLTLNMIFIFAGKNYQFHLWLIIIELKLGLVFKTWIQTKVLLLKIWIQNQIPSFIYVWNWNWNPCHDPNFGLATKARAWKSANWGCNLRITYTFSWVQENVKELTHTFPSGLPLWELEFQWTLEFSKNKLKGQNSLDW